MSKIIYKSDYFKCTFSTADRFNEQLQQKLDQYSAEGWLLHSYHIIEGGLCTLVFYREA